jgi:outer membrane lipoprotein-sorting protein
MRTTALLVCALACSSGAHLSAIEPDEGTRILQHVDALRNPLINFSLDIELTSYRKAESEVWRFRVYGQGKDKSLVEFLSPATEKGKYLLMLRDGMWVYVPSTSKPIRISPLQRLMGEASNGDVARTNYSTDYAVDSITSGDEDGKPSQLLDLKAKDPDMSYSRVKLWVSRDGALPLKADYYVSSGKLVKRMYFREFGSLSGSPMVTKVEILDVVRPDRRTEMSYSKLEAKKMPEKMFQPGYLGKW